MCREAQVTLLELNRDTMKIRAKRQHKAPENKHNQTNRTNPNPTPKQNQNTKAKRPGSYLIRAMKAEATVVKKM